MNTAPGSRLFLGTLPRLLWALVVLLLCHVGAEGAAGKVDREVYVGESVEFLNEVGVPEGENWTWKWNFGDGKTSTAGNATTFYEKPDTYDVTLTVVINAGTDQELESNVSGSVKIKVNPIVPKIAPAPSGDIYLGQLLKFNSGTEGPEGMKFLWDFGDGVTSTDENATHYYKSAGDRTVSLTVTAPNNVKLPPVTTELMVLPINLEIAPKSPMEAKARKATQFTNGTDGPPNIRWHWDFGDGNSSELKAPSHIFEKKGQFVIKAKYTLVDEKEEPLPGFDTNNSVNIEVTVRPTYEQPEIKDPRLEEEGVVITAEGNYTAHVMVEVNGTYSEVKLEATLTIGDEKLTVLILDPNPQTFEQAISPGLHKFTLVLPKPEDSISQSPVTRDLIIKAFVTNDGPAHKPRDITKTISVKFKPEQPAWLFYAYVAAYVVAFAFLAWLVMRWLRPVVPGKITINNEDHWLTSSPLGPRKGAVTIELGSYDPELDPMVMTISATGNRDRPNIALLFEGGDGEISANGDYFGFGKPIPVKEEMNFSFSEGRYLTYDPEIAEAYDSWGDEDF